MTLNGAIMELVMLSEHPMMPVIFKPSLQKIIETVSECEEPERKSAYLIDPNPYGKCSNCGELIDIRDEYNYCPNCGSPMNGGGTC